MYPEIFKIGDFPITTYGVFLAAGILLALLTAARLARKDGLSGNRILDLGLWTVIGGLLGSKLLLAWVEPGTNFFSWDFLRSGGVYYGGFIGGFVTLAALMRFYKLDFWKVADAFAPAVALGQAFGRQGCFAAGCCWGKPTALPWGVHFSDKGHEYTGVPIFDETGGPLYLHPTQLYESIAMLAVFALLYYLHRRKKFDGQIVILYGVIYGVVRFTVEFFRDDPRGNLLGLTAATGLSTSQIISLLVAVAALIFLIFRLKTSKSATA
jgi:phosphatidylglycerol:prolipoprotein diacylglycerol transferase